MSFWIRIGTALSQLANVVLFNGHPDETLSARSHYDRHGSFVWSTIYTIANFIFGKDHCKGAAESDIIFANYVLGRSALIEKLK